MHFTKQEMAGVKNPDRKTQPEKAYIKNFTEEQLKYAMKLLEEGYAFRQIDLVFGLPESGIVARQLKRFKEGAIVKPDPEQCRYDIDLSRVGPPKGNTRVKRAW